MRNVNICIVGPSKRFLSGISYYTISLANALSTSCTVSVICFRNLLPQFLFPGRAHVGKGISNREFSPRVRVFDGIDYNNPLSWYRAFRFLRSAKPDIIVLQWWTSSVSHLHLLLKIMVSMLKSQLIIEFHEVLDPLEEAIFPLRVYSRFMGRLLRKNARSYITHSESDKKLIVEKYKINPERITVIPHGLYDHYTIIEGQKARDHLSIKEEFVILSFGLIRKYKGIPYLIRAFEQLPQNIIQKSRLLIVGEIWDGKNELLDLIESSHVNHNITLIDKYLPDSEISFYFSAADIIVLPYLRASQSGVAHIAMTFKKPIIVSAVGGLMESMETYEGAFFVPAGNTEAIKDKIMKLFGSKKIYNIPSLGWDAISEKYLNVIQYG